MTENKAKIREQKAENEDMKSIKFVAIGHFTHDVVGDELILGGAASYSSIAAKKLDLCAGVITSVGKNFLHYERFDGIPLVCVETSLTTTFQNTYKNGVRSQIVKDVSAEICPEHIPQEWRDADIVYLCPVANEVHPDIARMFPKSLIGASPQGWMRQWDDQGRVSQCKWKDAPKVLPYVDVVIMSEEDILPFPDVVDEYANLAKVVVLTRGDRGSTAFYNGQSKDFDAFPVSVFDPTGAGDVFAVAFLKEFYRTRDLSKASIFANCTASFVVEDEGIEGIPDLDRVLARIKSRSL